MSEQKKKIVKTAQRYNIIEALLRLVVEILLTEISGLH